MLLAQQLPIFVRTILKMLRNFIFGRVLVFFGYLAKSGTINNHQNGSRDKSTRKTSLKFFGFCPNCKLIRVKVSVQAYKLDIYA